MQYDYHQRVIIVTRCCYYQFRFGFWYVRRALTVSTNMHILWCMPHFNPTVETSPVWAPLWFFFLQILLLTALSATLTSPISHFQSIKFTFPFLSILIATYVQWCSIRFQNVYFPIIASDNQPAGPSKILLIFLPPPLYFLARTSYCPGAKAMIKFPYNCREWWFKKGPSQKHII